MFDKKEKDRKYYIENREKILVKHKEWVKNNLDKHREYNKRWREKNKERNKKRMKHYHLKKYGISYEDWLRMWEVQDGRCAICGKLFIEPSDAYVDHNHKTDGVRGLLCLKCNFGLGFFNDDSKLLIEAIRYIKEGEITC